MSYIEILLFLSVLPSILLGKMIYKKDKVEKEPTNLLIKLFLGGIVAILLTLIISTILDHIIPELDESASIDYIYLAINTFIKVALVEEFSKWFFLKITTWKNKNFNYIYDAIVYAVFVSLGFATVENIMYVINGGLSVAILRALLSVPGHVFDGVFMGYYYGLSKQALINNDKKLMKKNMFLSILIPTILHFIFDYLLMAANILLLIIYLVFVIVLYVKSFKKINQISKIEHNLHGIKENYSTGNIKKRFCTNCGKEVDSNFCTHCGYKVSKFCTNCGKVVSTNFCTYCGYKINNN